MPEATASNIQSLATTLTTVQSTTITSLLLASTSGNGGNALLPTTATTDVAHYEFSPIWMIAIVVGTIIIVLLSIAIVIVYTLIVRSRKATTNSNLQSVTNRRFFRTTRDDSSLIFNESYEQTHQYDRLMHSQSFEVNRSQTYDTVLQSVSLPLLSSIYKVHIYENPDQNIPPEPYEEPIKISTTAGGQLASQNI